MTHPTTRLALVLVVTLSCQERLADGDPLEGRHICTFINAAMVYDEQGNPVGTVHNDPDGASEPLGCSVR